MPDEIQRYGGRGQTLSVNQDSISEIVSRAADDAERMASREKVPLTDVPKIQRIAVDYLRDCADGGYLPSVMGLASRLGRTRQSLYWHSSHHPESDFTAWLQDFSDLCGETMMEAAMSGSVKEVSAIFTAKSRYGFRDNLALEIVAPDSRLVRGDETAEAVAAKYAELPE